MNSHRIYKQAETMAVVLLTGSSMQGRCIDSLSFVGAAVFGEKEGTKLYAVKNDLLIRGRFFLLHRDIGRKEDSQCIKIEYVRR